MYRATVIKLFYEPTGNLDEENEQAIMQLFCDFMQKANKTVIMVTHNKAILTNVNHVLGLHNGTLYSMLCNQHREHHIFDSSQLVI
mgnify:CR=1 FL=1